MHNFDDDEEEDCVIKIEEKCFDRIFNRTFDSITLGSSKRVFEEIDDC
jgi:hypothetical protein